MANRETMVRLTIDVDYPYPSRAKSFLSTVLNLKIGKDYLKNSKTIAKMINESPREVKAYWFFTPTTVPDQELLGLLGKDKHEIGLHVANDPDAELKVLEQAVQRKINYYTIHGTERLLARLMWRRKPGQDKAHVPSDFSLRYVYEHPPFELDVLCYSNSTAQVLKMAQGIIAIGEFVHIHPEWLFQRGRINHRGPIFEALNRILEIDGDLNTLAIRKKSFVRIARDITEYQRDIAPTDRFIEKLMERRIDVFTFIERKWCCPIPKPPSYWVRTEDNIALLQVTDYHKWLESVGKKTRNMIRKAEKNGVTTEVVEPTEKLSEGIWKIYNETPIRQERAFPHYGESLEAVTQNVLSAQDCTFIGAFLQDELVGFIQLVHGNKTAIISQILSLQRHSDKAVNNALIAKAVEVCGNNKIEWLMYGRMGNHPSLDTFKQNNGFSKFSLTRYYVPITWKGRIATKLGMHREIKDVLPQPIKYPLIPLFNWVSRMRLKLRS